MKKVLSLIIVCFCAFILGLNIIKAEGCAQFKTPDSCELGVTYKEENKKNVVDKNFSCVWNDEHKFCSPTGLVYLSCGKGNTKAYDIPVFIPKIVSYAILILKTATPVILIFMGMFQLIKAIASQNEDEMKKARSALVKKIIASVIIFFMVSIVQFVVKIVADESEMASTEACLTCFLNNDCKNAYYYTDGYGNCYSVKNPGADFDCPTKYY